ncbi:terpene synthase family protein, partial [Streptomyces sp. NPDC127574]|uniref:terpene synthase family protein n=1 Tax=Streptomyces sp. NPDC127574 TaxID=3345401 RepID=UPI00363DE5DA
MTSQDTRAVLEIPALYCPFPPFVHPQVSQIDASASAWMRYCPIPQDPDDHQNLLRSGISRPLANSCARGKPDRLAVGGKWMYLGLAYDDWFESRTSLDEIVAAVCAMQRAQEAPGSALEEPPFLPAFTEFMSELREIATSIQYQRFTHHHLSYLHAILWEASHRLRGEIPDLNTGTVLRLNTGASLPLLTLVEICNGEEVPTEEINHPACQAAVEITALLHSWTNDLFSVSKDVQDGGSNNGLVNCLQREHRHSLEDAVTEAVSIWNRSMLLFTKLSTQL